LNQKAMPTYDYVCAACDHKFEEFQSISAPHLKKCPKCGKNKLQRLIGVGSGVIFKGGGFYETDYRSEAYKNAAKADKDAAAPKTEASAASGDSKAAESKSDAAPAKAEAKSEAKSEGKSEAKSEPKAESKPAPKAESKADSKGTKKAKP